MARFAAWAWRMLVAVAAAALILGAATDCINRVAAVLAARLGAGY